MVAHAFQKFLNRIASRRIWFTADASLVGLHSSFGGWRKRRIESAQAARSFGEDSRSMADLRSAKGRFWSRWLGGATRLHTRSALPSRCWMVAGRSRSLLFGLIHAYDLNSAGIMNKLGIFAAPEFCHQLCRRCPVLAGCHFYIRRFPSAAQNSESI